MNPEWKGDHGKLLKHDVLGKELVEFTSHVLDRMKQRRISEHEVLSALANPGQTGLKTQPGRFRVRMRTVGGKTVDVVYVVDEDRIGSITCFRPTRRNPR